MRLPPLTPYLPTARAIADEIAATHGAADGPDHPLAAGFDFEFAMRFTNRAFTRAGHEMTMPRGFVRVLNSGAFEVLIKGRETEIRFLRLSRGFGGWSFLTSEGEDEIPEADVWLLLRLDMQPIDRVLDRLRRPGADKISDRKLAVELGVSRDTVARGRRELSGA